MRKTGHQPHHTSRRRDRIWAGAFAAGVHVSVLAALLWPKGAPQSPPRETTLTLIKLDEPKPPGPPSPASSQSDASDQAIPPPKVAQVRTPVFTIASDMSDLLTDAQIAGAASAGEGNGGGGSCDMAQAVQRALRRDPLVRTAVQNANRLGKAIMMWNGDWVRSGGQEGKGLSAVREAIMWEVAFAPEACRYQPMRGLVLVSLSDSGTRFAIGSGVWRWSDLLGVRGMDR